MAITRKIGDVHYSDIYIKAHVCHRNPPCNGPQGKSSWRVRQPLDTDKRIAEKKLAELIEHRDEVRFQRPARDIAWEAFKARYLKVSAAKPPSTHSREKAAIKALEDYQRIERLSQLDVAVLEEWKAHRKNKGFGEATINRDIGAIRTMLATAVRWKIIDEQSWDQVACFKEPRGRPKFFTLEQFRKILRECNGDWKTIAVLGVNTGFRPGEIFHAAWSDVDFDRKLITVQSKPCEHCPRGKWVPKDYDIRDIDLSEELDEYLSGLKRTSPWIIGRRPKNEKSMSAYFKKIIRRSGYVGNLYRLRHTFASWLAQRGVTIPAIAKMMGHSDIRTTMIYAWLLPKNTQDAMRLMPRTMPKTSRNGREEA